MQNQLGLVVPNIHDFIFFKNYLSVVFKLILISFTPFCDTCDIFYTHYCALTLFYDSVLLLATKVCSHTHFVYLFSIHDLFSS